METTKLKILALIPARSGSKGVPNKNIRELAGHPLLAFSIAAAKLSTSINRAIVTTDSPHIAEIARSYGAETPFLRPAKISQDNSLDIEFIDHALKWLGANEKYTPDFLVLLRPTTPLRDSKLVDDAVSSIINDKKATSLRSAHIAKGEPPYKLFKVKDGYYDFFGKEDFKLGEEFHGFPRQVLPRAYHPNGYVDVLRPSIVNLQMKKLFGPFIKPFITEQVADIDALEDFDFAKELISSGKYKGLFEKLEELKGGKHAG